MCFLQLLTVMAFIFGIAMCGLELQRGVSIEQHRFVPRLTRWMLIVAGGLAWILLLAMVTAAGCAPVMIRRSLAGISPWQFCCNFGIVLRQPPFSCLILCTVAIIGFGIGLTLYERRRCIKT
jgi:hypothetical protein